jgi:hypothetical protein
MSILGRIFGWLGTGAATGAEPEAIEHDGYRIRPTPIREGGMFRLSATISRQIGDEVKQHHLIRADTFSSAEDAAEAAVAKAKRLIAEQGERMFG